MNYYSIPGLKRMFMQRTNHGTVGNKMPDAGLERILYIVENHFSIDRERLLSKCRKRELVYPRQIAMYLAYKTTHLSLKEIGRQLGFRDHTTVIHSKQHIRDLMDSNKEINKEVTSIMQLL